MHKSVLAAGCVLCSAVMGQTLGPGIGPRGVRNAMTQQPAPSSVAAGGLIWINGSNLGPVDGARADATPLPLKLGDVEVLINGNAAPVLSADPSRVVAQVPWETPNGLASVVIRRNGMSSKAARIGVINLLPAVRTADDKGFGELVGTVSGSTFTFQADGLGAPQPRVATGDVGPTDPPSKPRATVDVHVGGLKVDADVRVSDKRPGEFDITVQLPDSVLPGDLVTVSANNRVANLAAWRAAGQPEVTFLPLPGGTPALRAMTASDLRGGFFLASGAAGDDGCWPSILVDLRVKKIGKIAGCLTAANRNAGTPAVAAQNGGPLAAFAGPPQGDGTPGQGISSRVAIFQPSKDGPMNVDLPSPAIALLGTAADSFGAILAGTPPQLASIDVATGDVQVGSGGFGGAGAGGGGGAALNLLNLSVDLGDGLNKILSAPAPFGQGQIAIVVGDDEADPKRARLALLDAQREVTGSRDFADGWVPLVLPQAQAAGGGGAPGGGGFPGGGIPGGLPGGAVGGAIPVRFRLPIYYDADTRTLYVASRKADDSAHGLTAFGADSVSVIQAPAKTFIASCTANPQVLTVQTSRRIALLGGGSASRAFQAVCPALSFLVLDLDSRQFTAVELPGSGQINASARVDDMNDFLLAANTAGDTVFALDGASMTSYRFDLPQGVVSFANLVTVPEMELAVATGRSRLNGDGGFLIFDLANVETRQLLLPDGIASVQMLGVFPATRKLIARGIQAGNAGSQYLIYDLATGDVLMPDNPPGVVFVGNAPAAPGAGGGGGAPPAPAIQRANPKANTIEAVTYDADRKQNGVLLIRVP
ncbi:MAG: IPT/TIG domain-containing protein [Bryobacterales bacterium]|nr:IPT/TIG domain-containing protein [Bryobacterales bacterium]